MKILMGCVVLFVVGAVVGIIGWVKYGARATKTVEDVKNDVHGA